MSAMRRAFGIAGLEAPPRERLDHMIAEAMKEPVLNARADRLARLLWTDPHAMWEAFAAEREAVMLRIIRDETARREAAAKQVGGGPTIAAREGHPQGAPSDTLPEVGGGHGSTAREGHGTDAPSDTTAAVALAAATLGKLGVEKQRQQRAARPAASVHLLARAHAENWQASILGKVKIDGRALGAVTAGEARSWARKAGREARFVTLLTENMPHDMVVARVGVAEAEKMWKRAGEVSHAA